MYDVTVRAFVQPLLWWKSIKYYIGLFDRAPS